MPTAGDYCLVDVVKILRSWEKICVGVGDVYEVTKEEEWQEYSEEMAKSAVIELQQIKNWSSEHDHVALWREYLQAPPNKKRKAASGPGHGNPVKQPSRSSSSTSSRTSSSSSSSSTSTSRNKGDASKGGASKRSKNSK